MRMNDNGLTIIQSKQYEIDYTKVKTLEDVITILKSLDLKVYNNYAKFSDLKHLLKETESK